jgi:branched-chain amino acid aminotransferase
MYAQGVAAKVVSVVHNHPRALDPQVKSGNYLNGVLAIGEARRAGAHEAILCAPSGSVAEGATSNVFAVFNERVETPALEVGVLPGITRRHVLALCRQAGIPMTESRMLSPDGLRAANEVFLTSSLRGVLPVTRLDGRSVGDGQPGMVTRRIMALYKTWVAAEVAARAS